MRARARLNRLEQGRSSCAKCGQPSDHNYDVTHVDSFETYQEAVSEPAFCEACGSKVLFPVYLNLDEAAAVLAVTVVRVRPRREGDPPR
jgi:DNA-directed RNA polymerase subunit RPC12/RpoP